MSRFAFALWPLTMGLMLLGLVSLPADAPAAAHTYAAHGVIERIAPDRSSVTIHHHAIPGYMMEMTMDFPVHDPALLAGLVPGDKVDFTLVVTSTDAWIKAIHRVGHDGHASDSSSQPVETAGLKPGDPLPDATFLSEDNHKTLLGDFRGSAVALTFFFTRCPLPNYCPLMNRDFAATRDLLRRDTTAPQNWQFLSVSFDAAFDTPTVLASYGDFYRGHDADRWLFVAATPGALARLAAPLGLMVMAQGGSLSHNLRTIVIDPAGRLYRQFNGSTWTPAELAAAIKEAARLPAPANSTAAG